MRKFPWPLNHEMTLLLVKTIADNKEHITKQKALAVLIEQVRSIPLNR